MLQKFLVVACMILMIACQPSATVRMDKMNAYSPLSNDTEVEVVEFGNISSGWIRIGEAYFGDSGFTLSCGFEKMVGLAKEQGRKMGADALKIVEHKNPDLLSSCHRIKVVYYKKVDSAQPELADKDSTVKNTSKTISVNSANVENAKGKPENTTAIGYQIGGITLIGVDHEIRVSNVLGVHFGGGLAGVGGGLRLHSGPETHSSYFDLNYKDGGFGLMETLAMQYGGLIGQEQGLRYEIGIQKILFIEKDFKEKLFKKKKVPPVLFAVGLGWAW